MHPLQSNPSNNEIGGQRIVWPLGSSMPRFVQGSLLVLGFLLAVGCHAARGGGAPGKPQSPAAATESDALATMHTLKSPPSSLLNSEPMRFSDFILTGTGGPRDLGNRHRSMVKVFSIEKFEKEKSRFEEQDDVYSVLPKECSGVLIAPRLILTAAHCVCIARTPDTKPGVVPTAERARTPSVAYKDEALKGLGIRAVMDKGECASRADIETLTYKTGAKSANTDTYSGAVIAHDKFELYFVNKGDGVAAAWIDTDLAVIVLDDSVDTFPIYEPEWNLPNKGSDVVMIGYGPGDTHPLYGQRHLVENKISGYTISESNDLRLVIEASQLPDGKLTAYTTPGDSGGGCVMKTAPTRLLGISTISTKTNLGRKASIFTSVSAHRAWIEKKGAPYLQRSGLRPR